jgi:hypothetical protein
MPNQSRHIAMIWRWPSFYWDTSVVSAAWTIDYFWQGTFQQKEKGGNNNGTS